MSRNLATQSEAIAAWEAGMLLLGLKDDLSKEVQRALSASAADFLNHSTADAWRGENDLEIDVGVAGARMRGVYTGKINQGTSTATGPTLLEYPNDLDWGIHKNTDSGSVHLAVNDGGALKSVEIGVAAGGIAGWGAGTANALVPDTNAQSFGTVSNPIGRVIFNGSHVWNTITDYQQRSSAFGFFDGYPGIKTSAHTPMMWYAISSSRLAQGMGADAEIHWGSNSTTLPTVSPTDVIQTREDVGVMAQYYATTAQGQRWYNTRTDASNYERLSIGWDTNVATIAAEAAGTGTQRNMVISADVVTIGSDPTNTAAHTLFVDGMAGTTQTRKLLPFVDDAYDLGSASLTWKDIYLSGDVVFGSTFRLQESAGGLGRWIHAGVQRLEIDGTGVGISADAFLGWNSGNYASVSASDVRVYRDGPGITAQRNGANPQESRLYNTWTDADNYERLSMFFSANDAWIATQAAGTGSARRLYIEGGSRVELRAGGSTQMQLNSSGANYIKNLYPYSNNSYQIGFPGNFWTDLYQQGSHHNYGSYTDDSNYERARQWWDGTVYKLGTEAAGTGSQQRTQLGEGNNGFVAVNDYTDNTGIIFGQAGAAKMQLRPTALRPDAAGGLNLGEPSIEWGTYYGNNAIDLSAAGGNSRLIGSGGYSLNLYGGGVSLVSTLNAFAGIGIGGASGNTKLYGPSADILEQRNGTNPQGFRIYNTYDGANNEWARLQWAVNNVYLDVNQSGSGAQRNLYICRGGNAYLGLLSTGLQIYRNMIPSAAGAYDIGTNSMPWRDIFLRPSSSLTPSANGDLVTEATNDTTLTFKLKGSDGVVRSGTINLTP